MITSPGVYFKMLGIKSRIWRIIFTICGILFGISFYISIYFAITVNLGNYNEKKQFFGFYFGTAALTLPGLGLICLGLFISTAAIEFVIRVLICKLTPLFYTTPFARRSVVAIHTIILNYSELCETISCSICMEILILLKIKQIKSK